MLAAAASLPLITSIATATVTDPLVDRAESAVSDLAPDTSYFDCTTRPTIVAPPLVQDAVAKVPVEAATETVCAAGEVAQSAGVGGDKQAPPRPAPGRSTAPSPPGNPPTGVNPTGVAPTQADPCPAQPTGVPQYHYAGAYQYVTTSGVAAYLDQPQPCLATSDNHSLAEISVQSADGRQIVEVGWTVDRELNGDAQPHLFVYHWVDRSPPATTAAASSSSQHRSVQAWR